MNLKKSVIVIRNYLYYYVCWLFNRIRILCYGIFCCLPWGQGYVLLAFTKYIESNWYKERSKIFPKNRVLAMYFENDESWVFKRRITLKEKLHIFLCPFSCVNNCKKVLTENDLAGYI